MDKEKEFGFDSAPAKEDFQSDSSSRARNKTVMLTQELTNQVRNRFQTEAADAPPQPAVSSGGRGHGGFETPRSALSSSYDGVSSSQGFIPAPALQRSYAESAPPTSRSAAPTPGASQSAPTEDAVVWVRPTRRIA
ncbi:MAG: hypothetical protein EBZ48_11640 [Proteobacteria bacterium]|nr:hypothetical protein [Pseudomonadota bacterium]